MAALGNYKEGAKHTKLTKLEETNKRDEVDIHYKKSTEGKMDKMELSRH